MNKNQETIVSLTLYQLQNEREITEEKIVNYVKFFKQLNNISKNEEEEVIKEIQTKLAIKMDTGACLKERHHKPWYHQAKSRIDHKFWNRYKDYLIFDNGFSPSQVNAIDYSTDEILDMLGNPNEDGEFSRKGLVIGDVQSGKTTTYTAIINKAADAGYRIIILLTGTIEKLRQQTQGRLDSGFVGLDSNALLNNKDEIECGVGKRDRSVKGWTITSTANDFNARLANQLNIPLNTVTSPVLFVLKKNKSVLEKLEQWLKLYNHDTTDKRISAPMLLIDDEADNASVNTKNEDESPTAINRCIRNLLKLFTKSNYVGFTATPYANIFINPDTDDEMLKDDLFPRHFIYALEAPSTYIGATDMFGENAKYGFMIKNNDDCENYLPEKHKKDFDLPNDLPLSLKKAIASFMIANTIRDLRGDKTKHRTMLINISRFINIHEKIFRQVNGYIKIVQQEVYNYSKMGESALSHPNILFIKKVFEEDFENKQNKNYGIFTWREVQNSLTESIMPIEVRTINGGSASKNLNYDEYIDSGLRLVAIGGFSLSRGLTLEGLCTSYFYRNSKMYDTLMQMGRWFGYRKRYDDICRVWMSENSVNWYTYISEASEELKKQVGRMRDLGLTPEQFGLGVRSDTSSLMVTAINKMRYTEDYYMTISLSGAVVETPYLSAIKEVNDRNYIAVEQFFNRLKENNINKANNESLKLSLRKATQFLNVPKKYVVELLNNYESHFMNFSFNTEVLVGLIENYKDSTVNNWDVLIASGDCPSINCFGIEMAPVLRSFRLNDETKSIQMSGSKTRLGTVNSAKAGLTIKKATDIEAEIKRVLNKDRLSENDYFNSSYYRNPLLVIYPVVLKNKNPELKISNHDIIFGLSVGIPSLGSKNNNKYKYKINRVKWKAIIGVDDSELEESGETND